MIQVNAARLEGFLEQFAQLGKTAGGGVTRLAASDEDKQARDLFVELARDAGCQVRVDAVGNIFARREGKDAQLSPVLTGSHGDSQPQGGRFDGIYGVLAGLEALYSLNDQAIQTQRAIELVMWTGEEGSRFAPAMLGSAVFSGALPLSHALQSTDTHGLSLSDELARIGYAGTRHNPVGPIHAAVEIHIEQGPVLENENTLIGVVTAAMGQKWYNVTLNGMAAHAGTTPMDLRQDALLGLAQAVTAINHIGHAHGSDARATVGRVQVQPNSPNVIAGKVLFTVEFRHPTQPVLEAMDQALHTALTHIASENRLDIEIDPVLSFAPIAFDRHVLEVIGHTAQQLGHIPRDMVSGAGHDACHLSKIAPTAMIFIPCIKGISHNEREDVKPQWSAAGAQMLLHTLVALANEPE